MLWVGYTTHARAIVPAHLASSIHTPRRLRERVLFFLFLSRFNFWLIQTHLLIFIDDRYIDLLSNV